MYPIVSNGTFELKSVTDKDLSRSTGKTATDCRSGAQGSA
jgi:hypothetical protein